MSNYISDSIIAGKGLFAAKDYKQGEVVVDCRSMPGWYDINVSNLNEYQINHNWIIELSESVCSTTDTIGELNYMNHSRTPNCNWFINEKYIVAAVDILKNTELTIDYRLEKRSNRTSFPVWI
jgi:hypothetical protein